MNNQTKLAEGERPSSPTNGVTVNNNEAMNNKIKSDNMTTKPHLLGAAPCSALDMAPDCELQFPEFTKEQYEEYRTMGEKLLIDIDNKLLPVAQQIRHKKWINCYNHAKTEAMKIVELCNQSLTGLLPSCHSPS